MGATGRAVWGAGAGAVFGRFLQDCRPPARGHAVWGAGAGAGAGGAVGGAFSQMVRAHAQAHAARVRPQMVRTPSAVRNFRKW